MKTLEAIDAAIAANAKEDFRNHLGASVIGKSCARELWYIFHWAHKTTHEPRMHRLFDRGNREEIRFVTWLRNAGIHVQDKDPVTGKQFRIEAHDGHFGGSLDSRLQNVPDWPDPDMWMPGEFKTHNDKSYKRLVKEGVAGAKWEHFVQMQIYMHFTESPCALYLAINKNDDSIYAELVQYNPQIASEYIHRAGKVIVAKEPPPRINESPGWYQCAFCDMRPVCHFKMPLAINCRTCVHSEPAPNATWICTRYAYVLNDEEQRKGCADHTPYRQ